MRGWRAARRPFGRILTQAAFTVAVLSGILGLAIYVVPNAGPGWAYDSDKDDPTPAAEKSESPLALPPGLDAAPGLGEEPEPDDEESDSDSDSEETSGNSKLKAWAESLSGVDISSRALTAYGNAELALKQEKPDCKLSWTTLAGLGSVETNHGTTSGTSLDSDGKPREPIRGPALDGTDGNRKIPDTDGGDWDGDTKYDRAVGPLQFIPTTWERWQIDADDDGDADPNDIDDVAMAAGYYLCAGGRDLSKAANWYEAVYSYNHKDSYVLEVYERADEYGKASSDGDTA